MPLAHPFSPPLAPRRKNKFCERCRGRTGAGLLLPTDRVRGLPASLDDIIVNSSEGGVWSFAPTMLGDARFRVVNNTAVRLYSPALCAGHSRAGSLSRAQGCTRPRLAIFEGEPPDTPDAPLLSWVPIPENWAHSENIINFCVSRGTLIPAADRKKSPVETQNTLHRAHNLLIAPQTTRSLVGGPPGLPLGAPGAPAVYPPGAVHPFHTFQPPSMPGKYYIMPQGGGGYPPPTTAGPPAQFYLAGPPSYPPPGAYDAIQAMPHPMMMQPPPQYLAGPTGAHMAPPGHVVLGGPPNAPPTHPQPADLHALPTAQSVVTPPGLTVVSMPTVAMAPAPASLKRLADDLLAPTPFLNSANKNHGANTGASPAAKKGRPGGLDLLGDVATLLEAPTPAAGSPPAEPHTAGAHNLGGSVVAARG